MQSLNTGKICMQKTNVFLRAFTKKEAWYTVLATVVIFYIIGIIILRFEAIVSFFLNLNFSDALFSAVSLFLHPLDSFTYFTLSVFLGTAFLFGGQLVALRLYVQKRFFHTNQTASIAGITLSLFGCLACCGSVAIVFLLGILGLSLQSFPFGGQEIALVGFGLSIFALMYTIYKIDAPMVC